MDQETERNQKGKINFLEDARESRAASKRIGQRFDSALNQGAREAQGAQCT
jgi:hypothetical protein